MIRKLLLSVVLMLSVVITGCSSNSTTSKPNQDNSITESDNNKNDDSSSTEEEPKEDKENIPSAENKPATEDKETVTKATLSIYSEDPNTMEIQQTSTIEIDEDSNLKTKLTQLADSISKSNFDGLPIEIKSIDTVNGKKVATINLHESDANKGITIPSELKSPNWRSYFQGSAGGQITADTLLETFLQVKYKGEWIDGVKFLYNDENIEFEHVSNLSEIQYRN